MLESLKTRDPNSPLTLDDLIYHWRRQHGRCRLTDIHMTYTHLTPYSSRHLFTNASVDRINSDHGYTRDNIQLICQRINFMRANLPLELFYWACTRVANCRTVFSELSHDALADETILETHPQHPTATIETTRTYRNQHATRDINAHNAMNALIREEFMLRELLSTDDLDDGDEKR